MRLSHLPGDRVPEAAHWDRFAETVGKQVRKGGPRMQQMKKPQPKSVYASDGSEAADQYDRSCAGSTERLCTRHFRPVELPGSAFEWVPIKADSNRTRDAGQISAQVGCEPLSRACRTVRCLPSSHTCSYPCTFRKRVTWSLRDRYQRTVLWGENRVLNVGEHM